MVRLRSPRRDLIAYDQLNDAEQAALVDLLAEHPRYDEDFEPSPKVRAASEGRASALPRLTLSEEYLRAAGEVARVRVAHAGYRLAAVWARCLGDDGS